MIPFYLDPRAWLAAVIIATVAYGAGYGTRWLYSVSTAKYDAVVIEAKQARAIISDMTATAEKAKSENAQELRGLKAMLARDAVQARVLEVQRDAAEQTSARLLAANRGLLRAIELPAVVRDITDGAGRGGQAGGAGADPGQPGSPGVASGQLAVTADVYVSVCASNKAGAIRLADDYDQLREFAKRTLEYCSK